jgi:hypothetical protein
MGNEKGTAHNQCQREKPWPQKGPWFIPKGHLAKTLYPLFRSNPSLRTTFHSTIPSNVDADANADADADRDVAMQHRSQRSRQIRESKFTYHFSLDDSVKCRCRCR